MFIKVCGLKTTEQIDKAIEYGYDAIGIVTYAKSKRYCENKDAIELAKYAKGKIKTFVVGLTYSDVEGVADAFDYAQIYEAKQIPNLAIASKEFPPDTLNYAYYFYDASIGSGVFQEFPRWVKDKADEIIVAGGLNAKNVCSVIDELKPFGVDVSSGVETNDVKDLRLMREFIDAVKSCS
ncbi:MAG: phosphoribosylanthranilate isomerase [Sedimenticola sp.]